MGMHDESWCMSCGTSLPYVDHDVACGSCVSDNFEKFVKSYIQYFTNHIDRLIRTSEEAKAGIEIDEDEYFESDDYYRGAIETAQEFLLELNERFRNE
jgi:hypothetical protein